MEHYKKDWADEDLARVLSAGQHKASRWLTAVPATPNHINHFKDWEYEYAVKNVLNLPISNDLPPTCPGTSCKNVPMSPSHFQTCQSFRQKCSILRHNKVRDALAYIADVCHLNVQKEQKLASSNPHPKAKTNNLVADLIIDTILVTDVTITCPSSATNVERHSAHRANFAVEAAEKAKRKLYTDAILPRGGLFLPFGLESYGAYGKDAMAVLAKINKSSHAPENMYYHAPIIISVALQKGTAQMMSEFRRNVQSVSSRSTNKNNKAQHFPNYGEVEQSL